MSQSRCVEDLLDGASLPSDGPSGGKCTLEIARTLCASGACNPETDSCARAGGGECGADSDCAANRCSDGKCGSADGTAPCTSDNGMSVCQSGRCQSDLGRCIAATDGCGADSDCVAGGRYCDGQSLACVAMLGLGKKLPADEMHDAVCNAEVATAVCSTGACNPHTNACAVMEGKGCHSAYDCASNACLRNVCVPTHVAPTVATLSGGRCGVATVRAGSIGPSLGLLLLVTLLLRRRARNKPGPRA
jgi:hypothetical protein